MNKTDYHALARCIPNDQIDPEVRHVLDLITGVAAQAKPTTNDE
jgi:hypothetical protein